MRVSSILGLSPTGDYTLGHRLLIIRIPQANWLDVSTKLNFIRPELQQRHIRVVACSMMVPVVVNINFFWWLRASFSFERIAQVMCAEYRKHVARQQWLGLVLTEDAVCSWEVGNSLTFYQSQTNYLPEMTKVFEINVPPQKNSVGFTFVRINATIHGKEPLWKSLPRTIIPVLIFGTPQKSPLLRDRVISKVEGSAIIAHTTITTKIILVIEGMQSRCTDQELLKLATTEIFTWLEQFLEVLFAESTTMCDLSQIASHFSNKHLFSLNAAKFESTLFDRCWNCSATLEIPDRLSEMTKRNISFDNERGQTRYLLWLLHK